MCLQYNIEYNHKLKKFGCHKLKVQIRLKKNDFFICLAPLCLQEKWEKMSTIHTFQAFFQASMNKSWPSIEKYLNEKFSEKYYIGLWTSGFLSPFLIPGLEILAYYWYTVRVNLLNGSCYGFWSFLFWAHLIQGS